MSIIKHENILKVYELLHDKNYYVIVTELMMHGDLLDYFKNYINKGYGVLPEQRIKDIAR